MAKSVVDLRLIDPSEKEFVAALKKAHTAANQGVSTARSVKLDRDADFWGRFARDCMRERAGRRRSCKAGYQTPEVIAGWWTDPAGRRHIRVVGRTRSRYAGRHQMRGEGELRDLPPWWQVYPESVLAVRHTKDDDETYLACCRCGKVGTPESLGWMGDTCGPCFDRKADGGIPVSGFGHFSGWAGWQPRIGFSADSTQLVGSTILQKLRMVNREHGGEITAKAQNGAINTVVGTEAGQIFLYTDGTAYRWDGSRAAQKLVNRPPMWGRPALSPDGKRCVVMTQQTVGFTADLTEATPTYARVDGLRIYTALRFSHDGERLYGITVAGELVQLDPETLAETVIRNDVFTGLPRYGYPHELSVAADRSSVLVIRETNYPANLAVRIAPLDSNRPVFNLPLPNWHRPNAATFSPDGSHVVTADPQAGWVGIWKLPAKSVGFVRAVPEDPSWRGGQLQFSPDGQALAVMYSGFHQERGSTVAVWPWPDVANAAAG